MFGDCQLVYSLTCEGSQFAIGESEVHLSREQTLRVAFQSWISVDSKVTGLLVAKYISNLSYDV